MEKPANLLKFSGIEMQGAPDAEEERLHLAEILLRFNAVNNLVPIKFAQREESVVIL